MADDEATSALIAQMLAADYAAEAAIPQRASIDYGYNYSDEEEDDLYDADGKRKKKRKSKAKAKKPKKKPKVVKKPKVKPAKPPPNPTATSADGVPIKKKKAAPRRWTEEEEKLFLEALELHGRAWHKCVEHMKHTRTKQSFTSHAQKHFIKLYRDDISLPAKVEESGAGYTLSGKPLDKDSAAARAYGASGAESQASYRKMIKLRKADPKTVMLEMARCNIIQFGKKIQVFEVSSFFFLPILTFFSLSFSLCTLTYMYYYRCRCFNNDIQS